MPDSILKNGTYRFILGEWGQTKDHEMAAGFGKKMVACFKQEWRPTNVEPSDFEVLEADTPGRITVYSCIDPITGDGIEKGAGKIGFEMARPWSDFMAMFSASNASADEMGKPVYGKDIIPGMIDIEVKAIPGSGNFAPKNVMVSWRNVDKADNGIKLFKGAMSKTALAPVDASTPVDLKKAMGGKK